MDEMEVEYYPENSREAEKQGRGVKRNRLDINEDEAMKER